MIVTGLKLYPLPDGRFIVSYIDDLRKERIRKFFDEERKAKELYSELKRKKPLKERNLKNCSIEQLFEIFVDEVPKATIKRSPQLTKDFLEHFAFFKPGHIDETKLRGFYTQQKLDYDYTNYSLSKRKYQLQGFFNWMVSRGVIEKSPQQGVVFESSNLYRRPAILVSLEKIKTAIEKAKIFSPGLIYPILLLINETAAKTIDIMNLKWNDIDFKNKKVTLWERNVIQRRELPISDTIIDALKQLDQVSDYVFTNLESRPHVKNVLTRELRAFQRKAGLDTEWAFRDLRYSFAVNYLQSGGDIIPLSEIMGHLVPRITEETYGAHKVQNVSFFETTAVPETHVDSSD